MDEKNYTDAELIRAIQEGGLPERRKALAHLYKRPKWRRTIAGLILKQGGEESDIQDVLHDGFADFEQNIRLRKFQGHSELDTYLIGICKNKWYKKLEQKRKARELRQKLSREPGEQTYESSTNMERTENIQMDRKWKERLHELIGRLGDKCQEYLRLYMLDHSTAEIAEMTGLKNSTQAKKSTYNCRMRLRELLMDDPELRNYFKNRGQ